MIRIRKFLIVLVIISCIASCKKKDEERPVVTLRGNSFMIIILNSDFTDPGADAYDNTDGSLYVETTGTVNPDFAGTYYIVYSATDAAGNSGQSVRTVVVRNEAEIYNGEYTGTCYTLSDTTSFLSAAMISTTLNKRIWIAGFADHQNVSVFADISNDSIRFPSQLAMVGNTAVFHKYEGLGLIKTISDTTIFEIHFTDSVSGNITSGDMVYKKMF